MVYSDELVVAFRDIAPAAPTHILIVPREHIIDASAVGLEHGDALGAMFVASQKIALEEKIAATGYRLVFNVGEDAQNSVAHLHLHLVGGRRLEWPPG
jgi:histidine triad (HIT) family protein